MFVAAFPLAPAFALISNILEIRLDGYKYLTLYRRPVPTWARGIGAWGKILENVARFSIITNVGFLTKKVQLALRLCYESPFRHLSVPFHRTLSRSWFIWLLSQWMER